jgi:hypothetical protein
MASLPANAEHRILSQLLHQLDQQDQEAQRRLEEQEARHQLEREILVRRQLAQSAGLPVILSPAAAEAAARGSNFIMAHGIPREALEDFLVETAFHELQREQELRLAGRSATSASRGPLELPGYDESILHPDLLQSYLAVEASTLGIAVPPSGSIYHPPSLDSQEGKNLPTQGIIQLLESQLQASREQTQTGNSFPQSQYVQLSSLRKDSVATKPSESVRLKNAAEDHESANDVEPCNSDKKQRSSPRKRAKVNYCLQDDDSTTSFRSASTENQSDGQEEALEPPLLPRRQLDMTKLKARGKGKSIMDIVVGVLLPKVQGKKLDKAFAPVQREGAKEEIATTTTLPSPTAIPVRGTSKRRRSR